MKAIIIATGEVKDLRLIKLYNSPQLPVLEDEDGNQYNDNDFIELKTTGIDWEQRRKAQEAVSRRNYNYCKVGAIKVLESTREG